MSHPALEIEEDAATLELLAPPVRRGDGRESLRVGALPRGLLTPSPLYGIWSTIRLVGVVVALVALTPWLVRYVSPWTLIGVMPFLGAHIYKLTILMHDCAHYSLFRSRKANHAVGYVCGAFLATSFETFQANHWEHHRRFGRPGDPQGDDYLGLERATARGLVMHLLRPLWGYNVFKLLKLNTGVNRSDDDRSRGRRTGSSRGRWLHWGLTGSIQAGVLALSTSGGTLWQFFWVYPFCAASFGLFFSQVRGFCEHVSMPSSSAPYTVRTHATNWFDRLFFYDLSFNFHVEHHLYPTVPSLHLRKIFDILRNGHHTEESLSTSMLATIRRRVAEARPS